MMFAIAFGWYSSTQRAGKKISRLSKQLNYSEAQLDSVTYRSEKKTQIEKRESKEAARRGLFSHAKFSRVNMQGISVSGEFHFTTFDSCMLKNADLRGGGSAFQYAQFMSCNLANAKLTGGGSAFQMSSFVDGDLSGAVLTGGGASFQEASFQRAKLIGARIVCPTTTAFQAVNLDGAQFQGADLSLIDKQALESCFFETPPTYDKKTQFPDGFNPSLQLWKRVP